MQKTNALAVALLLAAAPALAAQGRSPADTGHRGMMQRMETRVKKELGLTEDQAAKLRATHERFHPQRREVMQRARAIHEALRGQLQPGVAANSDSVRKLLDARLLNRAALVQLDRDMDRDLAGYLSPVQRARMEMMHEHMRARGRMGMHGGPDGGGMRGMRGMRGHGEHGDRHRGGDKDDGDDMDHGGEGETPHHPN